MTEMENYHHFGFDRLGNIELRRDNSGSSVTVTLYNDMETLVIRMTRSVAAELGLNMTAILAKDSLDYLNDEKERS